MNIVRLYFHEEGATGHGGAHHHDHHSEEISPEERIALLKYMLEHNAHHAEELHNLAHGAGEEVSALIHAAVRDFEAGNEKIGKALELL